MVDRYLRDLPNNLAPSKIADNLQARINEGFNNKEQDKFESHAGKVEKKRTRFGMPEFEWIPDPYDLADEKRKRDDQESRQKHITDLPFVPTLAVKKGLIVA